MPKIIIRDEDLHTHLKARMEQRGITVQEIENTLNHGSIAHDAKEGTFGKTAVFEFNNYWEGKLFEEKEVTVYYITRDTKLIVLTAVARYGKGFIKQGEGHED